MSKQNEFRAWYPDEKKMEYPEGKTSAWVGDILTNPYYIPMQFIFIKDKNQKKIFFGDIVKVHIGKKNNGYEVVFEDGSFCLSGPELGGAMSFIKFRDELLEGRITGQPVRTPFQRYLEVIGNIYQNPVLKIIPQGTEANNEIPNATGAANEIQGPSGGQII